jgi:hypothetical protein
MYEKKFRRFDRLFGSPKGRKAKAHDDFSELATEIKSFYQEIFDAHKDSFNFTEEELAENELDELVRMTRVSFSRLL